MASDPTYTREGGEYCWSCEEETGPVAVTSADDWETYSFKCPHCGALSEATNGPEIAAQMRTEHAMATGGA